MTQDDVSKVAEHVAWELRGPDGELKASSSPQDEKETAR